MLKELFKNTRAEVGGGIVGVLIGLLVTLLVGIIVVLNLINSQTPDATWSASANTTWTALQSNTWVAFGLMVIVPIVVAASAIMFYVRRGM